MSGFTLVFSLMLSVSEFFVNSSYSDAIDILTGNFELVDFLKKERNEEEMQEMIIETLPEDRLVYSWSR